MTLLLLASSQMGTTESTEDLFKDFADWCLRNNLQINAGKTKELVVDFRRRSHSPPCTGEHPGNGHRHCEVLQDTLTALGSSFSERLLHPRCVKESSGLPFTSLCRSELFTLYSILE
ncbi:hypothetical protein L3Q82_011706 [Scortum barcoo]|uniref:Uncharacterized protein n=1 Tax=Scortum barcoo TaxID=214431 RepID=A0ACB8W5A8_9TELE|nr:hypothetical protein L3Q82_011706 [Scortum barcoo]